MVFLRAFACAQGAVFPQAPSLAIVGPLTPSSKAFGIPHLQGVTLAVDEYNQKHPDSPERVQLKIFDDQTNPSTSASISKQLWQSDVLAILGPANSASCAAVIGELQEQRIRLPVVSALCSATNLTANLQNAIFSARIYQTGNVYRHYYIRSGDFPYRICVPFSYLASTKRDLLEMGSDTLLIYQAGSVALGALSGFLGLRALYALMSYMGIKVDEKDLTGSGTKSEQSQPV